MAEWDDILAPPKSLEQQAGAEVGLPPTNPATPRAVGNVALQGAAQGARTLPMMGVGLAADALAGIFGLPALGTAALGAGAMGAYDKATGQSNLTALTDALLTGLGAPLGKAAGGLLIRTPEQATAKALGGRPLAEVATEGGLAAQRAGARVGTPLPDYAITEGKDLTQQLRNIGGQTDREVQDLGLRAQQAGTQALRGEAGALPTSLDALREVQRVLGAQGEQGARAAEQFTAQYLTTLDPVRRASLIQDAMTGNVGLQEARLGAQFRALDNTTLGAQLVDAQPLYDELARLEAQVQLPSQATRLRQLRQDITTMPRPEPPAGMPARTQALDRSVTPLDDEMGRTGQRVTNAVDQVTDRLKGAQRTTRTFQEQYTTDAGVRRTERTAQTFVQQEPDRVPRPRYLTFEQMQQLRSELLSVTRKLPEESGKVGGAIDQAIKVADEQMDAAGRQLAASGNPAYEQWRQANEGWRAIKDVQRDPINAKLLEAARPGDILDSVTRPEQLDGLKQLLTYPSGQVSPKWEEVRGTLLQRAMDQARRPDGTYDADAALRYLGGTETQRAATGRLFAPGELDQFRNALIQHQTDTDLATALGNDGSKLVGQVVGMDPTRFETLWGRLGEVAPHAQDRLRGAIVRDVMLGGDQGAADALLDGKALLRRIGEVQGMDPRKVGLLFPQGSATAEALDRAAETAHLLRLSSRLTNGADEPTSQFARYLGHKVKYDTAKTAAKLGIGPIVGGTTAGALGGPGMGALVAGGILGGEMMWRAFTRPVTSKWFNLAVTLTGGAGARATLGYLQSMMAAKLVPPEQEPGVRRQIADLAQQTGTPDGVRVRLTPQERSAVQVDPPQLDALRAAAAAGK